MGPLQEVHAQALRSEGLAQRHQGGHHQGVPVGLPAPQVSIGRIAQPVSDFITITKSRDKCNSCNIVCHHQTKKMTNKVKYVMETFESFEHWLKGTCLYKCSICAKDHHDFIEFGHHIEIDHEISVPAYIQGNMQLMRSNLVIILTCFSLGQGVLVRFYICKCSVQN